MTSRFRLGSIAGLLSSTLTLAGCGDAFNAGPMKYIDNEKLVSGHLQEKPKLHDAVRDALANLFGPDPQHIKVPEGSGLPLGGIRLANRREVAENQSKKIRVQRVTFGQKIVEDQEGGYALYRKHCLHCHGVSGAGDGPTSTFLYPRPRDYRKGIFKFTSTPTGAKPTRADLRKTIRYGLHGTSMPAFEALMSDFEMEQVLDYMTFLSMRGETELGLIDEVAASGELTKDVAPEIAASVFNKWKSAESQAVNPPIARTPPSKESVLRGRALFLARDDKNRKLECTGCHGPQAIGNGPSLVAQEVFNDVMFGGDPSTMKERLDKYDPKIKELWKNSLDDWGFPLRPANLNRGVYKGGRRPIDIYWRIAKGINGAKMPAHYPAIEPGEIWDLVNFVLALPYEPALLDGATLPTTLPAVPAPAVARR